MKLKNIRELGRFENNDSKAVNLKKGTRIGYGDDLIFYLFRGKRVFISDKDFYENWNKTCP